MKRVLVTGNAGSGKSTVARQIATLLNIPYHSLDGVIWKSGWKKTPQVEREGMLSRLTETTTWVIDGVSTEVQSAADTVVLLDVPRRVSFWRVIKRNRKHLFHSRPELPPGCPELLIIPTLVRIIWNFPGKIRPRILSQARRSLDSQRFFHVKTKADLIDCLAELESIRSKRDNE